MVPSTVSCDVITNQPCSLQQVIPDLHRFRILQWMINDSSFNGEKKCQMMSPKAALWSSLWILQRKCHVCVAILEHSLRTCHPPSFQCLQQWPHGYICFFSLNWEAYCQVTCRSCVNVNTVDEGIVRSSVCQIRQALENLFVLWISLISTVCTWQNCEFC